MIDTHCHLDQAVFDADRAEVLARSRQAGVVQWVVPAIRLADFPAVVALRSPQIHIALGLHPLFPVLQTETTLTRLAEWVAESRPTAIGEIGLDATAPSACHEVQRWLFEAQLELARQVRLPVLLHVRKAHDPVINSLRRLAFSCGGIVHAFNGTLQQAHRYLNLGFRLGMGGVVSREGALRIRQVASQLPDEALVLESDAPDLPPAGHLGERNEPCYLPVVVQALAGLRRCSPEHIRTTTTRNARLTLGLPEEEGA
ncbi:MAG: TatD family hydrolase [Magnetococcus sp. MYC-9]